MHSNLIIVVEPIKKAITIVAGHRIEDDVHERKGKCVRDRGDVKFSVIYENSNLIILLWDDDDRAEPCGPFYRSDEAYA